MAGDSLHRLVKTVDGLIGEQLPYSSGLKIGEQIEVHLSQVDPFDALFNCPLQV